MAFRKPALRPNAVADVDRETAFARSNALNSVEVTVTFSAGTTAYVRHGLGYRYSGGRLVEQTVAGTPVFACVQSAELCDAAGYDPSVYVYVRAASNNSLTYTFEVF